MGSFQVLVVLTTVLVLCASSPSPNAEPGPRRANLHSLKAPVRGVKMTRVVKRRNKRSLEDENMATHDDAPLQKRSASADPVYPYGGYQFQANSYRHGRPSQLRSKFYNTRLDSIVYGHFVPHELGKRSAASPPSYRGFEFRANSSLQHKKLPQARSKKLGKRAAASPPSYRGFEFRANSSLQHKRPPQARSKKLGKRSTVEADLKIDAPQWPVFKKVAMKKRSARPASSHRGFNFRYNAQLKKRPSSARSRFYTKRSASRNPISNFLRESHSALRSILAPNVPQQISGRQRISVKNYDADKNEDFGYQ